jgi:hypothetical protein
VITSGTKPLRERSLRSQLHLQFAGEILLLEVLVLAHITGDHTLHLPSLQQLSQSEIVDTGVVRDAHKIPATEGKIQQTKVAWLQAAQRLRGARGLHSGYEKLWNATQTKAAHEQRTTALNILYRGSSTGVNLRRRQPVRRSAVLSNQ